MIHTFNVLQLLLGIVDIFRACLLASGPLAPWLVVGRNTFWPLAHALIWPRLPHFSSCRRRSESIVPPRQRVRAALDKFSPAILGAQGNLRLHLVLYDVEAVAELTLLHGHGLAGLCTARIVANFDHCLHDRLLDTFEFFNGTLAFGVYTVHVQGQSDECQPFAAIALIIH